MAQPDNTIDPNDLDSIDALLDEAELEPEETKTQSEAGDDVPDDALEQDETPQEQEPEAASGVDLEEFQQSDQEAEKGDDLDLERMLDEPMVAAPPPAQDDFSSRINQRTQEDDDFDDFLARRAQNTQNGNELTVAEMDSLKSMIIGFGSTLIVLALIAIGIATWGALGANSSDLPSAETFEEMIGEAELGRTTSQANETLLKDLNRKLDALSFQIEQVNGDVVALGGGKLPVSSSESLNPLNLNPTENEQNNLKSDSGKALPNTNGQPQQSQEPLSNGQPAHPHVTQAAMPVNVDMSKLEGKVDDISRSLSLAQRRVVEINNRVKSLQQQYNTVLQSVKQVEKNMLEEKLAEQKVEEEKKAEQKAKLEEEKKAESKPAAYEYRAPGALNYESGNRNSYP